MSSCYRIFDAPDVSLNINSKKFSIILKTFCESELLKRQANVLFHIKWSFNIKQR